MKPINFVTRGKQSDFGMYFVCIGMVFYLSSSSRIIQKDMFSFPVSELRLRCWKKMALNPSSSGMQKCQQAGTSCPEFDVREMWSDFHDQKRTSSKKNQILHETTRKDCCWRRSQNVPKPLVFRLFPGFCLFMF